MEAITPEAEWEINDDGSVGPEWSAKGKIRLRRSDGDGAGSVQITYTVNGGPPITTSGRAMKAKDVTVPSVTFVILTMTGSVPYAPEHNNQSTITVWRPS